MSDPAGHAQGQWRALRRANRLAHADAAIHASQIGQCLRAVHYRAQESAPTHPPSDLPGPAMAVGEILHRALLPGLAQQWRTDPAVAAVVADEGADPNPARLTAEVDGWPVTATPDMRILWESGGQALYELKTTGSRKVVDAARRGSPRGGDVDQCLIGAVIAEHVTGIRVDRIILDYLDTGNPDHRAFPRFEVTAAHRDRGRTLIGRGVAAAGSIQAAPRHFGRTQSQALAPHSPCLGCVHRGRCLKPR